MKYKFSRWVLIIVIVTVHIQAAKGQNGTDISIPSTPAFSILNYEPASVMRPSNPKELSADILNSIDKNGKLLLNLGIEVSPYWLKSRPQLTRKQYIEAKGMQALFQSLTLSAATVKDSASKNNKLGIGFRFKLNQGNQTQQSIESENELINRATLMSIVAAARAMEFNDRDELILFIETSIKGVNPGLSPRTINLWHKIIREEKSKYSDSKGDLISLIEDVNEKIAEENLSLQKQVVALAKKRTGIITEVAGASSFITSKNNQFEKFGVWFNASNVISQTDAWNFSARYFYASSDSSTTNFDVGFGYIKELSDFSVSFEGMARFYQSEIPDININNERITRIEKGFTYRLAAQAAYRISQDISVNISLGKAFDSPFVHQSGFFSIFGVNYSVFKNSAAAMPAGR